MILNKCTIMCILKSSINHPFDTRFTIICLKNLPILLPLFKNQLSFDSQFLFESLITIFHWTLCQSEFSSLFIDDMTRSELLFGFSLFTVNI